MNKVNEVLAIREQIAAYHAALSPQLQEQFARLEQQLKELKERQGIVDTLEKAQKVQDDAFRVAEEMAAVTTGKLQAMEEALAALKAKEQELRSLTSELAERESVVSSGEKVLANRRRELEETNSKTTAALARQKQELEDSAADLATMRNELESRERRFRDKMAQLSRE